MVKVSEASDAVLDWMVLKALGHDFVGFNLKYMDAYPFSSDWAQGGPIIEREGITNGPWDTSPFMAHKGLAHTINSQNPRFVGPTPLIAAMRCYVGSKLGDTVEVPKELIHG